MLEASSQRFIFGAALRRVRTSAGLSQTDVHRASGVPLPMISDYERAKKKPQQGTLEKLIEGLRNRRVSEEMLTELQRAWEGSVQAPEVKQEEPQAHLAPTPVPSAPTQAPTPPAATVNDRTPKLFISPDGNGWWLWLPDLDVPMADALALGQQVRGIPQVRKDEE